MSTPEQPKSTWLPQVPFGLKVSIAASGMVFLGVFFLTTINHSFRASLYAGVGTGIIFLTFFLLIWVVASFAKENNW